MLFDITFDSAGMCLGWCLARAVFAYAMCAHARVFVRACACVRKCTVRVRMCAVGGKSEWVIFTLQ